MPSSNPIRKEILQALEDQILPALKRQEIPLGFVTASLEFPTGINTRLISKTVPRAELNDVDFPVQTRWPRAHLHSTFGPYMGIIYEGKADERTLVTAAQAAKFKTAKGVYAIRWQAPSVLLFPPGTAHCGGNPTFWDGNEPAPAIKILWISVWSELLMHTHINNGAGQRQISHSLQIEDKTFLSLAGLFMEELEKTPSGEQGVAQAMLLAMMLRLRRNLLAGQAKIANTSRSSVPLPEAFPSGDRTATVGREAAIFIQMHLHEPLSLSLIAQKAGFSPAHLNRLFQQVHGVSVMRYVRKQRVAASKKILASGSENVAEIAQLTGFKRANLFCRTFREETGLSPIQFRRDAQRYKSTFHNKK